MSDEVTTAAALIEFYRELAEADLPQGSVRDLMQQAGQCLMHGDGTLVVRNPGRPNV